MAKTGLKHLETETAKSYFWRAEIGGFMRMAQENTATCRRLSATDPGLVVVINGRKIIRNEQSEVAINAGYAVALPTGQEFYVTNEVGTNGRYEAHVIYFDQATLPAVAVARTKGVTK